MHPPTIDGALRRDDASPSRVAPPLLYGAMALASLGCTTEEAPASMPEASTVSLDGLGPAAVHGTIDGEPFEAVDQRFVVVTRAGRERLDLRFSDRAIERCGLPIAREDRRVWIRFPERTSLEPGRYERLDDEGAFEVHYEGPGERGRYHGVHRGIGRVEVTAVSARAIEGRLHVCFADASRSCVSGAFRAAPCLSRVDGRALRESPGLADDVLERAGAPP